MDLAMQVGEKKFLTRVDWNFVLVILALNLVGLINLYSATHGIHATSVSGRFIQQVIWLAISWSAFWVITFIDYGILRRIAPLFFGLNVVALVAVMFFGSVRYGAQRWLDLGFFQYQPSETMKFAVILILARVLSDMKLPKEGMGLRQLLGPVLLTAVPFILIVNQPDLGTSLMILAVTGSMLLFIRVRRGIVMSALLALAIALPVVWNFGLRDYQKNRVLTFLSPTSDPRGTGYNSIQSKIAVGSGRVLGKGFRKGTQSQLEFLPERHTDFIYSVLSEEHGFVGSVTTLGLFAVLFLTGIRIASQARDKFGALLTIGVTSYVFWHMFVNIGMVIGLLPIVGVPLPLLSYGGSSMLTTMCGLGLIGSVAYRRYLF